MSTRNTPTLLDIANAAEVSTATVSRVLNNPEQVREKLRDRIEGLINEMGYVRHGAARALASSRTRTIGAVIPTLESAIFSTGVNALGTRLATDGYTLLLAVTNYDFEHEHRQVRDLLEHGVDGMMLVGRDHAPETLEILRRHRCPFVSTWTYATDSAHPCVGFNNVVAARAITEHLLDLGHIHIGVIAGITAGNDRARERVAGVRDALDARGLSLDPAIVIERPYEISEGREGFRSLMSVPEDRRPTAVFCGNDVLAIGAIFEAQDMGMDVPGDVSIVGFDNLPLSAHLRPALSTVHVPSKRMGEAAAEYLLRSIDGETPSPRTELPTALEIRETTAPPRR